MKTLRKAKVWSIESKLLLLTFVLLAFPVAFEEEHRSTKTITSLSLFIFSKVVMEVLTTEQTYIDQLDAAIKVS